MTPPTSRRSSAAANNRRRRGDGLPRSMLDLAAGLFAERGYAATSTQDLAEAMGMQKGSLYYWIETKEDFLLAIVREAHDASTRTNVAWRDATEPLEALRRFVEGHVAAATENITYTTVYIQYFSALSAPRRREILAARDAYEGELRGIIARARDLGAARPDVDPRLTSLAILGMVNWIVVWYRPGGRLGFAEIARQFADQAVASVACPVPG